MDILGVNHAVHDLNAESIPALVNAMRELVSDFNKLLDRLNGTSIVIVIPEEKK